MTASLTKNPRPPFTLRRCLWLCLPALLIGAILRISLLVAIPEIFYGGDSNSYFVTTSSVYNKHRFDLPTKRRFVYPVLLLAAPPVPFCNTAQVVAVIQHLAGLVTLFGIGWITGHLVRRPTLWVPLVTSFAALWPRMLYFEHEMVCESLLLGVFVATVAVAIPRDALTSNRRLIWFCFLALIIVAVKPAGRPLWLGLILAAAMITRHPFRWPKVCYATFPLILLITFTSGGDSQGPWLFLSSTLPLVRTEGEPYAAERALLRPAVESARHDLPNYAFHQGPFKKMLNNNREDNPLGPDYTKFVSDRARFNQVAKALAREAVLHHPFLYLGMVAKKIVIAADDRHSEGRLDPAVFWRSQVESSKGRWDERPEEMRLVYEMDEPAYNAMVEERSQRTLWFAKYIRPFQKTNWLTARPADPGHFPLIHIQLMGWLALLGLVCAFLPGRFVRTSLLWLPLLLYLFIIYAIGDTVTRYLHPVEWVLFVLMAFGLDTLLEGLVYLYSRVRPLPASSAPTDPDPIPTSGQLPC